MKRRNIGTSRYLRRNQTDAERKLWIILRNRQLCNIKFRRQFPVDKYILDFYAPECRLGLEADGGQHYEDKGKKKDEIRTKRLLLLGIKVLRFSDRDILTNLNGVLAVIQNAIETQVKNPPHLSPLPQRERKWLGKDK